SVELGCSPGVANSYSAADHYQNRQMTMTNLSKNGVKHTALNLDGGAFDEAAYRAELIAAGLPAKDAAGGQNS
ncbi:MAG: hypothetical protein ABI351_02960, partial [Herbaspirillum sp.]